MHILVTTDGSEHSLTALPHAVRLANAGGARVTLARVIDPHADLANKVAPTQREALQQVTEEWLQDLGALLLRAGGHGEPKVIVRERGEDVHDAVLRYAAGDGVTMIVLDTRGTGALRHAFLGSVALNLIGKATLPVMATGASTTAPRPGDGYHVLATFDGSPASATVAVGLAALDVPGLTVTLLSVYQPRLDIHDTDGLAAARVSLEQFRSSLPAGLAVTVDVRHLSEAGTVDGVILRTASEAGADAIAMATHGHSALRHVVAGSVALDVLSNATVPVILTRQAK